MAFQVPALPGIATVTAELWPSMAALFGAPGRTLGYVGQRKSYSSPQVVEQPGLGSKIIQEPPPRPTLPEFLHEFNASRLAPFNIRANSYNPPSVASGMAGLPKGIFAAANPIARRMMLGAFPLRHMSTSSTMRKQHLPASFTNIGKPQRRTIFGGPQNLLAHMEETANKNPQSAGAQNAFYQALLRANMPRLVVERYESGRFASSSACKAVYQKALDASYQMDAGDAAGANLAGQPSTLNSQKLQTVGQAVAASAHGGNVAISRGQMSPGAGARDSPVYVVVEETIGNMIFKWVKLFLYFGLIAYLCIVLITLAVESLTVMKRVNGGKGENEAKAEQQTVRFSDVHGCDEAKEELQELVDFLKNPEKFSTLGGKLPKGVLLVGPPGTGKTLLARAVAGEAGVPFFFMSGSEFDEVYVGVGAKRVRELFTSAKSKSPAIVFIDELDAIGGKRNPRDMAYARQTLNQLLTELDGFQQNSGVIILAATNFPELLDKALTRPGRFDRNVVVGLPDVRGRIEILRHHTKNTLVASDVNLETLASETPGFSGADLENIVNQAAVRASKAKALSVSMMDFEWARDKVMMGAEKKSMVISPKEKEMTAYHEAGHALVCMFNKHADKLHKVTIMPRGQALGITMHLPAMDKYSKSMREYQADIDVCLGGKIAEEMVYGDDQVTSGVSSDLQRATDIAYMMVTQFGMSPRLGNVDLRSNQERISSATKELIDSEVRRTIEEARVRATALLRERRKELDILAKALVDYETLSREEIFKVIKGDHLEGKPVMPNVSIKVPEGVGTPVLGGAGALGGVKGVPALPGLPGTRPSGGDDSEPPNGGVMA